MKNNILGMGIMSVLLLVGCGEKQFTSSNASEKNSLEESQSLAGPDVQKIELPSNQCMADTNAFSTNIHMVKSSATLNRATGELTASLTITNRYPSDLTAESLLWCTVIFKDASGAPLENGLLNSQLNSVYPWVATPIERQSPFFASMEVIPGYKTTVHTIPGRAPAGTASIQLKGCALGLTIRPGTNAQFPNGAVSLSKCYDYVPTR